jgi:hypothetical protein
MRGVASREEDNLLVFNATPLIRPDYRSIEIVKY